MDFFFEVFNFVCFCVNVFNLNCGLVVVFCIIFSDVLILDDLGVLDIFKIIVDNFCGFVLVIGFIGFGKLMILVVMVDYIN